ncbi:discoidin domain-containing protein [Streptomyces sp. NPDC059352]|uniref:discoidin domain-containing protein n=1 Tax=Streptomyces sp. NPDC059352 TaxID=3346810 RepID=UPI0036D17DBE
MSNALARYAARWSHPGGGFPRRRRRRAVATAVVIALTPLTLPTMEAGTAVAATEAEWAEIRSKLEAIDSSWTTEDYRNSVTTMQPDTALLGNGDVGVVSSGSPGVKTFIVTKGDFISSGDGQPADFQRLGSPGPIALGGVTIESAADSRNLAPEGTATASSVHDDFAAQNAISGTDATGEGWVSAVGDQHWLQVDLGSPRQIGRYVILHRGATFTAPGQEAMNTRDWALQTSADGTTWTDVDTVTGNTANRTDRSFTPTQARYVRLNITNPTQGSTPDTVENPRARIPRLSLFADPAAPNTPVAFRERQDILNGEINTEMMIDDAPVQMSTWVGAKSNRVITTLKSNSSSPVTLNVSAWSGAKAGQDPVMQNSAGVTGDTIWALRKTPAGRAWVTQAALATSVIGAGPLSAPTATGNRSTMTIQVNPGTTVNIVTAVEGGGKNPADPRPNATAIADQTTQTDVDSLFTAHRQWWKDYWLKSFVNLNDPLLERYYYGAQYQLGSTFGEGTTTPSGLYGIWTTRDDAYYGSDLHLNYNAIAPLYGAYSSNRPELAKSMTDAFMAYLPEAKRRSKEDLVNLNPTWIRDNGLAGGIDGGALFPVGITANGDTSNPYYYQQTMNGLFSATAFISSYKYTQDRTFLRDKVVPFIRPLAVFFKTYLRWDATKGQYVLYTGHNEGGWSRNSSPDLGVLKLVLKTLIEANTTLGINDPEQETWKYILSRLPAQPTKVLNGKTVFTLADPGTTTGTGESDDMNIGRQTVNLEFIHPGELIGIRSDPVMRKQAIDTLDAMNGWANDNTFPKSFTQAARVGYPAQQLVDILKARIQAQMVQNLRISDNHHGIEKAGAIEAINNMLLQSDGGVMVLFPGYPTGVNASFVRLREKGAFQVSAARTGGTVTGVTITSETSTTAKLQNPWPGRSIRVRLNGSSVSTKLSGGVISWSTTAGSTYVVEPR